MSGIVGWADRRRPVRVYSGFAARRELFTSGGLDDAAVIHVAAHMVAAASLPGGGGLVLSQLDAAGTPLHGLLSRVEVQRLGLSADLVVLAGCGSAAGRSSGEPVAPQSRSLAEAFLRGGARRAVGSLWPVDDAATASLMVRFHEGIWRYRLPPASALRRAQRLAAAAGRPADEWAAFVLVGDWQGGTP
jgi:CHAT domain-containing protein